METLQVRLMPLDPERFAPYGEVLRAGHPVFPEVEAGPGRIAMEIGALDRPYDASPVGHLTIHFSYSQAFIPLEGALVLLVAPRPAFAPKDQLSVDYARLAAFSVRAGEGALIEKGVWHVARTLGGPCRFVNVTRKDPGEGQTVAAERGGSENREYVWTTQIAQRDGRVIRILAN